MDRPMWPVDGDHSNGLGGEEERRAFVTDYKAKINDFGLNFKI